MADGRHFENSFMSISQPWARELSDFDHIWYAFWLSTKTQNFANSRWRMDAILKIVFYISAPYWPINAKLDQRWRIACRYRSRPKLQFSKIQDGGRPTFWK